MQISSKIRFEVFPRAIRLFAFCYQRPFSAFICIIILVSPFQGGFAKCYELRDIKTGKTYAGKIISKNRIAKQHQREKVKKSSSFWHCLVVNSERCSQNAHLCLSYWKSALVFLPIWSLWFFRTQEYDVGANVRFFSRCCASWARMSLQFWHFPLEPRIARWKWKSHKVTYNASFIQQTLWSNLYCAPPVFPMCSVFDSAHWEQREEENACPNRSGYSQIWASHHLV